MRLIAFISSHRKGKRMNASRTYRALLGLALAALAFPLGAVTAQTPPAQEQVDEEVAAAPAPVRFTVVNNNWADMKIYALRHGGRYRLGTVTSFRTETFELPRYVEASVSEIQLLAVPIGGSPAVVSPVVLANPGDELKWRLEGNLALSGTPIG